MPGVKLLNFDLPALEKKHIHLKEWIFIPKISSKQAKNNFRNLNEKNSGLVIVPFF